MLVARIGARLGGVMDPALERDMVLQTIEALRGAVIWEQTGFPAPRVHDSVALFWYERLKSQLGPAPGRQVSSCDDMDMLA